jgi:uncharacterized membrane protein
VKIIGLVRGLLLVLYPFVVYVGLARLGVRTTATCLLVIAALSLVFAAIGPKEGRRLLALGPVVSAFLFLGSVLSESEAFLLALPALINCAFLVAFALTLRTELPMAERFARLYVSELPLEERIYCRNVTLVWCLFFAFNAAVAAATALFAPLGYWSLYNGVLAYVLSGLLFLSEYLIRKYRFRRFGTAFYDRVLERILPLPPNRS